MLYIIYIAKVMHIEILSLKISLSFKYKMYLSQKVIKIGDFGCAIYSEDMRKTVIGTL